MGEDENVGVDRQWWLKDRRIAGKEEHQLSANEMLEDLQLQLNYVPRRSPLYYELRYNYDYVNIRLFKNECSQIIVGFKELASKLEKLKKMNPVLKEKIAQMKAESMERAVLWDRVRREVYADFKQKDSLNAEKIEQKFIKEDLARLRFLEERHRNKPGIENLKQVEEMMLSEKKSLQECVHDIEKHKRKGREDSMERFGDGITKRKARQRLKDKRISDNFEFEQQEKEMGLGDQIAKRKAKQRLRDNHVTEGLERPSLNARVAKIKAQKEQEVKPKHSQRKRDNEIVR